MAEELGLFGEEPEFSTQTSVPERAPEPAPEPVKAVEPAPVAVASEESKGEKTDAPPASERPRDDSGKFVKRDEEHMVPLSAMLSERERRQAAEAKLQEAEKQKPPTPDIWTDPEAFVQAKLSEREPEILAKAEVRAREQFFMYTENAAKSRHNDYDKARDAFVEEAQRNPLLASKLRQSADPGEFIYQQGRIAMELKEVGGDLAAYRTRIETELRQKLEKEQADHRVRMDSIPQSLNSEPSKGAGVRGQTWAGPASDDTLFPER